MTVKSLCLANKTYHREACHEVADGTEAQSSSCLRTTSSAKQSFSVFSLLYKESFTIALYFKESGHEYIWTTHELS